MNTIFDTDNIHGFTDAIRFKQAGELKDMLKQRKKPEIYRDLKQIYKARKIDAPPARTSKKRLALLLVESKYRKPQAPQRPARPVITEKKRQPRPGPPLPPRPSKIAEYRRELKEEENAEREERIKDEKDTKENNDFDNLPSYEQERFTEEKRFKQAEEKQERHEKEEVDSDEDDKEAEKIEVQRKRINDLRPALIREITDYRGEITEKMLQDGDKLITHTFNLRGKDKIYIGAKAEDVLDLTEPEAIKYSIRKIGDYVNRALGLDYNDAKFIKFSTVIYYKEIYGGEEEAEQNLRTISTKAKKTLNEWNLEINEKLKTYWTNYESPLTYIYKIEVKKWLFSEQLLGINKRAVAFLFKKYIVVSAKTIKNCLYTSLAVIKNHIKQPELLAMTDRGAYLRKESGRSLKREIKDVNEGLATYEDIQKCSNYLRKSIKLYDNMFKLVRVFKTERPLQLDAGATEQFYEIREVRGHVQALILRSNENALISNIDDRDNEGEQEFLREYIESEAKEEDLTRLEDEIIEFKKRPLDRDFNIMTYDIETYLDDKKIHRPYSIGLAWFEYEYGDSKFKTITKKRKSKGKKTFGNVKKTEVEKEIKTRLSRELKHVIFKSNNGTECIEQFSEFLLQNADKFKGYTCYGHNAGKFDNRLIFETLLLNSNWTILANRWVELNGDIVNLGISDMEGNTINFKDSRKLLDGSLKKLADDFKTEYRKLDDLIDHSLITRENCLENEHHDLYLKHDLYSLLEIMDNFSEQVYKAERLNITACITGASLAKKIYFNNYYDSKKHPIYTLSTKNDAYIRAGYCGGANLMFKMGEVNTPVYYYDKTSLYPSCGRMPLPFGKCVDVDFSLIPVKTKYKVLLIHAERPDNKEYLKEIRLSDELDPIQKITDLNPDERKELLNLVDEIINLEPDKEYLKADLDLTFINKTETKYNPSFNEDGTKATPGTIDTEFFGFFKAWVRTKDYNAMPIHALKRDSKLNFCILDEWTLMTGVPSIEINYDIYEYKFIDGKHFKKATFMKSAFTNNFNKKALADENKQTALKSAYKIAVNSLYGVWGLKTENRDGITITPKTEKAYRRYLHNNTLVDYTTIGETDINRVCRTLEVKDFNVGISSMIASYARLELFETINDIKNKGGRVYYCDTDSIMTDLNLSLHSDLLDKWRPDRTGKAMGSLKNEANDMVEKQIGKEGLAELLERENGDISFNCGVFTGLKQYALYKEYEYKGVNYVIDMGKLKGYNSKDKKLEYKDMKDISDGKILNQSVEQWIGGKDTFTKEKDPFTIRIRKINKRFRKLYTKGIINEDGDITPLLISSFNTDNEE